MTSEATRVVLVTGCSTGGIGFALCEQYAEHGCKVYATSRRLETMKGFTSPNISLLALDVCNEANIEATVKTILEKEGHIDVLVNNAGLDCAGPIIDVPLSAARQTFETNFFSVIALTQAVLPHMAARESGVIVNMGSRTADFPYPWHGIYAATKAAQNVLTDVLWQECQAIKGVNVVLVASGGIKTNFVKTNPESVHIKPDSLWKAYTDRIINNTIEVIHGDDASTTEGFAKLVVPQTLALNPPRYITGGGHAYIMKILDWLPRGWVLSRNWELFSKAPKPASS